MPAVDGALRKLLGLRPDGRRRSSVCHRCSFAIERSTLCHDQLSAGSIAPQHIMLQGRKEHISDAVQIEAEDLAVPIRPRGCSSRESRPELL